MRVPKSTTKLQGFAGQRQASEIEKILSAEQVQPNSGSRSRSRESAANFQRTDVRGYATSSPTWGGCELDQRTNSSKAKVSNNPLTCDCSADSKMAVQMRVFHAHGPGPARSGVTQVLDFQTKALFLDSGIAHA